MSFEADQAQSSLGELDTLLDRSRVASRSMVTGLPLLGWGITWTVGLPAVEVLDGIGRIVVCAGAWLIGMLMSWWPMRTAIRTGTETTMRRAWFVVLGSSPLLVAAARPESFTYAVLLLGALWGLAMCLYAVATEDWGFAAVAGFGIVAAAAVAGPDLDHPLSWYGVAAGLPLVILSATRAAQGVRNV